MKQIWLRQEEKSWKHQPTHTDWSPLLVHPLWECSWIKGPKHLMTADSMLMMLVEEQPIYDCIHMSITLSCIQLFIWDCIYNVCLCVKLYRPYTEKHFSLVYYMSTLLKLLFIYIHPLYYCMNTLRSKCLNQFKLNTIPNSFSPWFIRTSIYWLPFLNHFIKSI